jgi:hypothetical protein
MTSNQGFSRRTRVMFIVNSIQGFSRRTRVMFIVTSIQRFSVYCNAYLGIQS